MPSLNLKAVNILTLIAAPRVSADGERIFVAGFPLGTYQPVKRTGRVLSQFGSPKANQYVIQADIRPGNSGGPLLNSSAQLCGVVTGNLGSDGIAGVQRAESVNQFLGDLIVDRQKRSKRMSETYD